MSDDPLVWYASFGTNLSRARLGCYISGGTPVGARRAYEGCRDRTSPREHRTLTLPGHLRFAGESSVWGGGMAFYSPTGPGTVHARAYLLRLEQLVDLVAQEARRAVGTALVLADTGHTRHGLSTVYDVLMDLGELDGHRVLTLSASRHHPLAPPSAAYLRTMADGLADGFDLDVDARVAYLASAEGMLPTWTPETVRELLVPAR
ncbi:histone deacetylase [Nocardioides ganghwensis]|uniref:histone deacetylase n=1 Tax=Nocardioides ganghwensis TaxID=252230 RepID=UPI0017471A4D|nr:histone deacetylase [Nocardioides ganghwensis]MBD3944369.1 histone deacetylase [Nocardioides ganghwensis]